MTHRIVLSGCSGGGKSTLLRAMQARGFKTFTEPGRRAVRSGISFVSDPERFMAACTKLAVADFDAARGEICLYDRSFLEVIVWYRRQGKTLPLGIAKQIGERRYATRVYVTPPWPEIYQRDAERQHDLAEARLEYAALCAVLPELGYVPLEVPKRPIADRAEWLATQLEADVP